MSRNPTPIPLLNFRYAATTYLTQWLVYDSKFHEALSVESDDKRSEIDCSKILLETAKYYKVIRTLPIPEGGEETRLLGAYRALKDVRSVSEDSVHAVIDKFAETLNGQYNVTATSAASKFLWMRFRAPIIIYDSVMNNWIWRHTEYKDDTTENYCRYWREIFTQQLSAIREACSELPTFRRFTPAASIDEKLVSRLLQSRWFEERVFDIAVMHQEEFDDVSRRFAPSM